MQIYNRMEWNKLGIDSQNCQTAASMNDSVLTAIFSHPNLLESIYGIKLQLLDEDPKNLLYFS